MTESESKQPGPIILVTGAGGFLGQAVLRDFVTHGHRVRAFVRQSASLPGAEVVVGDITDAEVVGQAMKGITVVVHLAARKNDETDSDAVNVGGARIIADACKAAGVRRIVNVSTQSVRLRRLGVYGTTKLEAESVFKQSGIPVVTLRPSVVYGGDGGGVFDAILRFARLPVIPMIGNGEMEMRPIHRDDLAAVIRESLTKGSEAEPYDVGGPEGISFRGLIDLIQTKLGTRKPILRIPILVALLIASLTSWMRRPPITRSNVYGAAENLPMDTGPMERDFGVRCRGIEEGLQTMTVLRKTHGDEATLLLSYVTSAWKVAPPDEGEKERYLEAMRVHGGALPPLPRLLLSHPWMLGGLDAVKKTDSVLAKKLLVAAAIAEASVRSADEALPKNRSLLSLILLCVVMSIRAGLKVLMGALLLLHPSLRHCAR